MTNKEDMKHDKGKARFDLLPWDALRQVAKVLEFGAAKYGENSWRTVKNGRRRYRAAMLRHYAAIERGEEVDNESGLPHVSHIACNALFIAALDKDWCARKTENTVKKQEYSIKGDLYRGWKIPKVKWQKQYDGSFCYGTPFFGIWLEVKRRVESPHNGCWECVNSQCIRKTLKAAKEAEVEWLKRETARVVKFIIFDN